jgi:hypothetical protein
LGKKKVERGESMVPGREYVVYIGQGGFKFRKEKGLRAQIGALIFIMFW